ncbi:MAG TPA: hypothetical protein VHA80_03285 [Solirubrobacterales bacterium]|nr:hypothetical protein [Solirubrobacterales bacterium]
MTEIACVAIPRFALVASSGQRRVAAEPIVLLRGRGPAATVVEASWRAEARGVAPGMSRAQALARCPDARLALPDPLAAEELWARVLARLEGLGAAVEAGRPGEAFFGPAGLLRLHRTDVAGVLSEVRRAMPLRVRAAAAPSRFASFAAAVVDRRLAPAMDRGDERTVAAENLADFLAPLPVGALAVGPGLPGDDALGLVEKLGRLGVETLGSLAALGRDQMADRFGNLGLAALGIARGEDRGLRPREPREELVEVLELPDGAGAGAQLEHALGLLVERLLASPERRRRTLLAVRLSARLDAGGSWSVTQALGRPSASAATIAPLLARRLEELPGPPVLLALRATSLGPAGADQLRLPDTGVREGEDRLAEAIRQLRLLQGPEAILDVVDVEPDSHLPEAWSALVPWSAERHARRRRERAIGAARGAPTRTSR